MELIPPLLLRLKTALFPRSYPGKGKTKGQSIIEYALVIGVVVAALVGTQAYIKRGLQGRLRDAADTLGQQYEPKNTVTNGPSVMTSNSISTTIAETLSEQKMMSLAP
jgi:Flp pilus assembly pilin Flp